MPNKLNGIAFATIGTGSLFIWSGFKGWSILATIGDMISGKAPQQPVLYSLSTPGAQNPNINAPSGGNTGNAISDDALKYQGHAYKFGGSPGTSGQNPWDCSSYANWIVGHDMQMAIPGMGPGKYNGSSHGPPTLAWAVWPGLHSITRSQVQAGDIIVWTGHMGIAISNTNMVSALDPADGTKITPIDGFGNGPLLKYGRL